ncbi:hypothetical protein ACIPDS_02100 [Kluyvera sp. NPDC087067]|uniref:hypothetical protein n=1 Tax=Kluyvera sp. NPDC087067 TaxID=3364105 RepID=UPI00380DD8F5
MYALKTIGKNPEGKLVENVRVLGKWYNLEFEESQPLGDNTPIESPVARISYADGGETMTAVVNDNQDAYITTLQGDTVRVVRNRGIY